MNNNSKILFFFTSSYPYGNGETFVENEIHFLEKAFDKIIIFSSGTNDTKLNRYIPNNAEVIFFNSNAVKLIDKLISLKYLFMMVFWKELFDSRTKLKTKSISCIIKTLLIEIFKAKRFSLFIKEKLSSLNYNHQFYFYSYWLNYNAIALIFLKQAKISGKFFSRAHGWDLYNERSKYNYLPLRNFIYQNLDAIFPISIDGTNYINSSYKKNLEQTGARVLTSKLGSYYNGLNPENKRDGVLTLLSCSMIYPNKQVDLIAKTLVNLNNNQKIHWIHFGSYIPNFSEKHYEELLAIINNNKNNNLQINLMGFVDNSDIMKFYSNNHVDFFINVSLSEGIPVSIMEAMSFGIPVIATNVGGTSELVIDNFNGLLLSPNPKEQEVSDAISRFSELDTSEIERLRTNAHEYWRENYDADTNYHNFVNQIFAL